MDILTNKNTFQNIKLYSADSIAKITKAMHQIWDFLTISVTHPFVYSGKALTITIQPGNLSLAYGLGYLGKIRLKNYKSIKYDFQEIPKPNEALNSTLSFIKEHNIDTKDISLCIPKSMVATKLTTLPASAKDNISDVIRYELDRLTPFSIDEAFFDYKIVSEDDQNISLQISTVRKSILNPYIESFNSAGLNVRSVNFSINCLGAIPIFQDKAEDFAVLNLKTSLCEIGIFQNAKLISANHTPIEEGYDENKTFETISQLIKRTPNISTSIANKKTLYIFLNNHTEKLTELIKNRITPYIKVIDERRQNILDLPQGLQSNHTSIAAFIQTLWHKSDGFDLLKSGKKVATNKPFFCTLLLMLCLVLVIGAYFFAPVHLEKKKIVYLEGLIKQKRPEVTKAEALQKEKDILINQISQIEDFKHSKIMTIDIVKEMTSVLPKNAWLTRLRIADKKIEIEGYASSASEILAKLEASEYFEKVEFASPTYKDMTMKMDRFQIKMDLEE